MTPNLFLATQTLFSPHKWFVRRKSEKAVRKIEHWQEPIAGTYEYIPGRGWYLVAIDEPQEKLARPAHIKYSRVLKRYLLETDYESRKKHGKITDEKGKVKNVSFFRLDDGISWVHCWDEVGNFLPGPYKLWVLDAEAGRFRHMLKGDDPEYSNRRNSRDEDPRRASRRSLESRSTQFRGSSREKPVSGQSTQPSSVREQSIPRPSLQLDDHSSSPTDVPMSRATTLLSANSAERATRSGSRPSPSSPGAPNTETRRTGSR
ncbi:hypothetical protein K432DRAFT_383899 [Lepidopterella palustris CBS 459.81]|uniref:Uncharacterized protein n=1 Tax=Lepidopterella palustris CBS 459.81 TaxID=1314670 RepID=A0A8E2E6R7_9PEZI|nr:hypothetical protein K432DRAFT_383899 [Lepidopterella palustris CBS 459.81]